jgi:hypothetical protein
MKMIRHHHETPGKPTITGWAVQEKCNETLKRGLVVEDAGAALHAERQQIRNVPVAVEPHPMETTEPARRRFVRRRIVGRVP